MGEKEAVEPLLFLEPKPYSPVASKRPLSPYKDEKGIITIEQIPLAYEPQLKQPWYKTVDISNILFIVLNTVATIVTVFLNKIVFQDTQLRQCQTSVVILHFTATFLVLKISTLKPWQLFEAVRVPLAQIVPISLFFAGFLVLNNLSLTFNSVGFYQLTKILTTPCVVLLSFVLFGHKTTQARLVAVIVTCVGVSLTNSADAQSNPLGALIAAGAFVVTALYQIWIERKLQTLAVSPPQLLMNQAAVSIVLLSFLVPVTDVVPVFSTIPHTSLYALAASAFTAAMINLSQFLIIGRTSALTFNIVGMIKTISILSLGWFIDDRVPTLKELSGVMVALGGAWLYAQDQSSANK